MSNLVLTTEQVAAEDFIFDFIQSPDVKEMVLTGYAGTGKSTLVKYFIDKLPSVYQMAKLINPAFIEPTIYFTATTGKAAENLRFIAGKPTSTVHSLLKLRPKQDFKNRTSTLIKARGYEPLDDALLIIDEISTADSQLLMLIGERLRGYNVKVLKIGDPAQLIDFKCSEAPAFKANLPTIGLTEPVRQGKGIISPITEVATMFKEAVTTGRFKSFEPDGQVVQHLSRKAFDAMILADMSDTAWDYKTSQYLAYHNAAGVEYNKKITTAINGTGELSVGDYAINNTYVSSGSHNIKTEATVFITGIESKEELGVKGKWFELNDSARYFMPNSKQDKQALLRKLHKEDLAMYGKVETSWIDLRAQYACTVHKSQGSTYDRVYVDLDDIGKARNHLARLLYVAASRPSQQLIFTGDI